MDLINQLAGLPADSALAKLRDLRPDVVQHTQGSYDSLLEPVEENGLTRIERALVALRVAVLTASQPLTDHYHQRLDELGAAPPLITAVRAPTLVIATLDARTVAILRHVDLITQSPGEATPAALQELQAAGLSVAAIVTLSQLIAFLSFQVRTLAVVSLLAKEAA
ncbi:MAG: CMD domain protein [Caldilineaceae bacterium]|nr:CMD domain protein [Caldilineaceae bacterium]